MKNKHLMGFGLLVCAALLVTACNNGWNSSSVQSEEPSSSELSSEPEPIIPVDGVDLTYPLKEAPVNPITAEMADQAALQLIGIPNVTEKVASIYGRYVVDFFYEHNHLTNDELVQTLALVASNTDLDDYYDWSIRVWGGLAYYLAYVDADHLYYTIKEFVDDGVAFTYLTSIYEGSGSDYINADTYY